MTPQVLTFLGTFALFIAAVGLAFWLGRISLRSQLSRARNEVRLHEGWLHQSRENCGAWEKRYDREKADHQRDATQFAAMAQTCKERDERLDREYAGNLKTLRVRVEAVEAKIPKHGPGGKFVKK